MCHSLTVAIIRNFKICFNGCYQALKRLDKSFIGLLLWRSEYMIKVYRGLSLLAFADALAFGPPAFRIYRKFLCGCFCTQRINCNRFLQNNIFLTFVFQVTKCLGEPVWRTLTPSFSSGLAIDGWRPPRRMKTSTTPSTTERYSISCPILKLCFDPLYPSHHYDAISA